MEQRETAHISSEVGYDDAAAKALRQLWQFPEHWWCHLIRHITIYSRKKYIKIVQKVLNWLRIFWKVMPSNSQAAQTDLSIAQQQ